MSKPGLNPGRKWIPENELFRCQAASLPRAGPRSPCTCPLQLLPGAGQAAQPVAWFGHFETSLSRKPRYSLRSLEQRPAALGRKLSAAAIMDWGASRRALAKSIGFHRKGMLWNVAPGPRPEKPVRPLFISQGWKGHAASVIMEQRSYQHAVCKSACVAPMRLCLVTECVHLEYLASRYHNLLFTSNLLSVQSCIQVWKLWNTSD